MPSDEQQAAAGSKNHSNLKSAAAVLYAWPLGSPQLFRGRSPNALRQHAVRLIACRGRVGGKQPAISGPSIVGLPQLPLQAGDPLSLHRRTIPQQSCHS